MRVKETAATTEAYRHIVGDLYAGPAVTDAEVAAAKENMILLEAEAGRKKVALYKLEVQFGIKHHINGFPTYGMLTFWESGTKLHGGGDAMLYVCPGKYQKKNECEAIIPDHVNGGAVVMCPKCLLLWKDVELIGQIYYKLPIQKWAEVMYRWFIRLNMNADIRKKYNYEDIRVAAAREQQKEMRGDLLERARSTERRVPATYPLANIIRDVNAGADMTKRILSFLRA